MPENEHEYAVNKVGAFCIHCGAPKVADGVVDERTCVRHRQSLRPEPARRLESINEFDVINSRMLELRKIDAANRAEMDQKETQETPVPEYLDDNCCG